MKKSKKVKIDPDSDFYRICPNCQKEQMVTHRNRIFCPGKCADKFHNKKKLKKYRIKPVEQPPPIVIAKQVPVVTPVPQKIGDRINSILQNNIVRLNSLNIPDGHSIEVPKTKLDEMRIELAVFSKRIILHKGREDHADRFIIEVGRYTFARVGEEKIRITKLKNKTYE